jgi:hypothetical protein
MPVRSHPGRYSLARYREEMVALPSAPEESELSEDAILA